MDSSFSLNYLKINNNYFKFCFMSFFKDFFGGFGEAACTVGALALGAAEAAINKIDGKDNDEIMEQWERTIEAGADLGSRAGSGLGELVHKHGGEIV